MRNTSFVYGFQSTDVLVKELKPLVSVLDYRLIKKEMEKRYINASVSLVDDMLVTLIEKLQQRGHKVFALTSNKPDSPYIQKSLEALRNEGVCFSSSPFIGELKTTGAIVKNNSTLGTIIHCSHGEDDNKGAIMSEFISKIAVQPQSSASHCILVDNTKSKCEKALDFFSSNSTYIFEAIHFTMAEDSISAGQMKAQLSEILEEQHVQVGQGQLPSLPGGLETKPCVYA
eukprot:CAMPEP_0113944110 /NCGR_PEP_ID=MMETSP1339-20121228/30640_1 /TAXON_ID=94617 /ORGANISM="Fibrocapsa japonica" /LENGTH=228 /DNA_ID=CAMNT_0000949181 /DNA_START=348 /DNA_END=1034 /DNA_ORIENTATION=+ /assembly_acc=CAM_ASM_000762